jgi:hypothetical protein
MPRGPDGERRPADVVGNAVHVMWIAAGLLGAHPDGHRVRHFETFGSGPA